jgi:hypothetical protein
VMGALREEETNSRSFRYHRQPQKRVVNVGPSLVLEGPGDPKLPWGTDFGNDVFPHLEMAYSVRA